MEKRIPLFRRTLGVRYEALAPEIRAIHDVTGPMRVHGRCDIARGGNLFSRFAGWLVRAPAKAHNQPFFIDIAPEKTGERWVRDYNGKQTVSTVKPFSKRRSGLIKEHFGLVSIIFALKPSAGRLAYDVRSVRFLGIPLPPFLRPRIQMQEIAEDRQCRFDINVTLPLGGRMMRMTGWLVPAGQAEETRTAPAERPEPVEPADTDLRVTQPITERNRRSVPPVDGDDDAPDEAPSQRMPRPAETEAQTVPIRTQNVRHVPEVHEEGDDAKREPPKAETAPQPTPSQHAPHPANAEAKTVPASPSRRRKTPPVPPEEPQARAPDETPTEPVEQQRRPQKPTRIQR